MGRDRKPSQVGDKARRVEALKTMFAAGATAPNEQRFAIYLEKTGRIPVAVLERAIELALEHSRGPFAPGIGDLFHFAGVAAEAIADENREALISARLEELRRGPTIERLREMETELHALPVRAQTPLLGRYDSELCRALREADDRWGK